MSLKRLNFRKAVPLWLFLTGLLIVGVVSTTGFYLPRLLSSPPDFQLSLSPSTVYVRPEPSLSSNSLQDENSSGSQLTLKSVNGFSGFVSLSANFPTALAASVGNAAILLGTDAARFGLNVSTTLRVAASALGDYSVTVVATSGSLAHSTVITVHSEDLAVHVNQAALSLVQGSSVESEITFSSLGGFSGNLSLDVAPHEIFPGGCCYNGRWFLNGTLSADSIVVKSGLSSSAMLKISAGAFLLARNYNLTITASLGDWIWQTQVSVGISIAPEPSLTMVGYSVSSATNATLFLRNGGPAAIEVLSYKVNDTSGDSFAGCFGFPVPTGCFLASFVDPGAVGAINVELVLCGACSYSGSLFTYQQMQTYSIIVTTSKLHSFSFSIMG